MNASKILVFLFFIVGCTQLAIAQHYEKHWIQSVSSDGLIIKIEDGSLWKVDNIDRIYTALWLVTENVIILDDKHMINTDNNKNVSVTKIYPKQPDPSSKNTLALKDLIGSIIIADDGQSLGKITNKYDSESIANKYGNYGSKYSSTSILNEYGLYGGKYSSHSPFNKYTTTPPKIFREEKFICYLTVNTALSPRIDPDVLLGYLQD